MSQKWAKVNIHLTRPAGSNNIFSFLGVENENTFSAPRILNRKKKKRNLIHHIIFFSLCDLFPLFWRESTLKSQKKTSNQREKEGRIRVEGKNLYMVGEGGVPLLTKKKTNLYECFDTKSVNKIAL